ncbi:hypothetical protein GQ457_01G046080 [Hibiscus cannabinus]
MERLPRDVVLDILSRLPVTTLVISKSVCPSWRSIIQDSVLVDKHLLHMSEPENDPCIIFHSPPPILDHYYFVDFAAYSGRYKRLKSFWVPTMHGKLVASSNGLLCFCSSSAIYICNPLTKDSVELPKLSSESGILGFGFSPTTKEYKVLDIIYQRKRLRSDSLLASFQSKVQILTLGDSQWRSLGMVPYQFIVRQSQVTVCGRLHWISQDVRTKDRVISFDLTAELFQPVPLADHVTLNRRFFELVALRGHLCVAASNADCGLDIWVMKEYNVKESWVKEFIIGGYLPKELRSANERIPFFSSDFSVVCSFKGGKILLKLWRKDLVLYDPVHEKFEDPMFEGALQWHKMVVHVGSLVLILVVDVPVWDGTTRRMERLPQDVVLDILSRLPVTTLAISKSVCPSWRSIIQGSVLVDKHLLRMSEPENDPCIIFQSPPPILDHYYFVDFAAYSGRYKRLMSFWVPTMHGKLVASSNGLLCFCSSSAIYICNPLTKDSVELPKLSSESGILGFGFSPTTKEYKVLDIIYQRKMPRSNSLLAPFQSKVRIFTLGDSQWRSLGMVPYQFVVRQSQVTVCGRLHWISQEVRTKDRIISFDLTAEQFQAVPLADHMNLERRFFELVALRGHLCVAASNVDCGLDIWVMKEYNVKESWVKEFVIGGYLPKELRSTDGRIPFLKSDFSVVCSFKGGKILLKLWRKDLVLYDPVHEKFEEPMFEGALQWHKMVVHVGSLVSL